MAQAQTKSKYNPYKKKKKIEKVILPSMQGKLGNQDAMLEHNAKTNRYDLKTGDKLLFSSVSHSVCVFQAEEREVVWNG